MAHDFKCNPSKHGNITDPNGFYQTDLDAESTNCFAQLHFKLDQIQKIVEGEVVLDDDTKSLIKVCLIAIYEAHVTTFIGSNKFNQLILAKSYNDEPPEYQLNQSSVEPLPNFFEILKKNGTAEGVLKDKKDANFYKHLIIKTQQAAASIVERITVLLNILKNGRPSKLISENLQNAFSTEIYKSKYKTKLDEILKQQSVSPEHAKGQDTLSEQEQDAAPTEQEQDILLQIEMVVSDLIYIKIGQDTNVSTPNLEEATPITDKNADKVVTDMLNKFNANTIFKNAIMKLNNIFSNPSTSAAEASEAYKLTAQVLITSNEVKLKINNFVKFDGGSTSMENFVKYDGDESINEVFKNLSDRTIFERFHKNTTSP